MPFWGDLRLVSLWIHVILGYVPYSSWKGYPHHDMRPDCLFSHASSVGPMTRVVLQSCPDVPRSIAQRPKLQSVNISPVSTLREMSLASEAMAFVNDLCRHFQVWSFFSPVLSLNPTKMYVDGNGNERILSKPVVPRKVDPSHYWEVRSKLLYTSSTELREPRSGTQLLV